ncbi:MAG: YbjQ family protein [Zoogloeaceae bacterium]|jgi:uncharacterized protein YbjQ (UPF0145 family)|nr:YbjQ family protein [Zoogloeaceae bacterium]
MDKATLEALLNIGFIVFFLVIGYTFGSIGQARHYRSLKLRERMLRDILIFNERKPPPSVSGQPFMLVSGSVVMGSDYFRQVIASLKALFGGRLVSFEAMMDRGRREAIVRMKEEARKLGANAVFNVRLETSNLSAVSANGKGGLACLELVAYGTAFRAAQ